MSLQDLTEARGQVHNLQAQLVKKDAALEEKSVQVHLGLLGNTLSCMKHALALLPM